MAKYSKKLVDAILSLVESDMSVVDICSRVGIARKTFYEWMSSKSEFAQAVDDARERAYDELIMLARQALREKIVGYTVEEITYTYEPSSYDESEMVLKKKVVKQKRKDVSIASLNNIIRNSGVKKDRKVVPEADLPIDRKQGMISPRNREEALILADFYKRIEQGGDVAINVVAS